MTKNSKEGVKKLKSEKEQTQKEDYKKKRKDSLYKHFEICKSQRTFFLLSQYPYMLIGKVTEVFEDYVEVQVDTSIIETFEDRLWYVHIDLIQTFYNENENGPEIPILPK
jgi:hypothetical protein